MNWADLFERAAESETDAETIRATLDARRENAAEDPEEADDA